MTQASAKTSAVLRSGAIALVLVGAYPHVVAECAARTGVFPTTPAPRVLTEEALLPLATEMLRRSGGPVEVWSPRAARDAAAPDHFLHRRGAHRGAFYFTNAASQTQIISFALEDARIRASCRIAP